MPPKRRAPAATSPPPPPKTKTSRQSALAKEHSITAATEAEIKEAFTLFANADNTNTKNKYLPAPSLRRALTALGVPPSSPAELAELLDVAVDPDDDDEAGGGAISYANFVAVAALKLNTRSEESAGREVDDAFRLFLAHGGGGGQGERITMETLKRVAAVLKENVGEEVLRDMLLEANGGGGAGRGVDKREFEGVMRRAGVFR